MASVVDQRVGEAAGNAIRLSIDEHGSRCKKYIRFLSRPEAQRGVLILDLTIPTLRNKLKAVFSHLPTR